MQEQTLARTYRNEHVGLQLFVEQSENCQVLIGKIKLRANKQMLPLRILISFRGIYRIYSMPQKDVHNSTESHIDITQTLSQFENVPTKRLDKTNSHLQSIERQECFLEGVQKISKIDEGKVLAAHEEVDYPFLFNLPVNTPPSLDSLWFANKRIEIAYLLAIKGTSPEENDKDKQFTSQFEITVRQPTLVAKIENKFCNAIKYQCYTRFFCKCLGLYHMELSANVLHPGQLQVQGRIFREGKKTEKIINSISISLMGEMLNVKKMVIIQKNMYLHQNQFEMLEGEVLLSYNPNLKTFHSELITIRFWIECHVEFVPNIWKFVKKSVVSDIIL